MTYGISDESLLKHKRDHIPALLRKDFDLRELVAAGDLAERVEYLLTESVDILEASRRGGRGSTKARVAAAAQVYRTLELVGRVSGQLSTLNVFFVKHGIQSEDELDQIVTAHRQSSASTVEQCREDGIELLRWVIQERPEWVGEIRTALFGGQLLLTNGNAGGNGSNGEG